MAWNYRRKMEEMISNRFLERSFVPIPEASKGKLSEATKILTCRQQLAELDEMLTINKEAFRIKIAGLESRRLAFKMKEQQLESHLAKFDYYIRENDMKSSRAMKKAHVEKCLVDEKARELVSLTMSMSELQDQRDSLKATIDKHQDYARYLEQVLRRSEDFSEVRDIVSRYETLKQTYEELSTKEEESVTATESQRQHLSRYVAKKDADILSLTNKLSEQQLELERLLAKTERLDNQMTHIETTAAEKTLELGRVRMSTHAMYHLMLKQSTRMSAHNFNEIMDPVEQLDMICTYIVDLTRIVEDIKKTSTPVPQNSAALKKNLYCD